MLPNAPRRLREMMAAGDLIWGPGVYDGISARLADAVGFPMLYMTGAGTAASRIGQPDLGLTTMSEMAENVRVIAGVARVPVIADADTGFGGPPNVARTVHAYEAAGAAGLHIEDQAFPKRCGHLQGKVVVGTEEFVQRIKAAANERYNPDFVIVARTDALQPNGFEDALDRLRRAFDAGADVGFFEGPTSVEQMRRIVAEAPGPMLLNVVPNGATPMLRVDEVRALGFRFAIFPSATMMPAALAIRRALETLKRDGSDAAPNEGKSPRDLFAMVGLDEQLAIDERSGSKHFATA
ncbi:MAG: isocitrate lyase/PEP mutase family protein [Candidatus Eremiobacteraeota bacterium]|nr:isocitrate lyase/PEP mutase family protein [Candidatus Eremiobacteraeota bacterium]